MRSLLLSCALLTTTIISLGTNAPALTLAHCSRTVDWIFKNICTILEDTASIPEYLTELEGLQTELDHIQGYASSYEQFQTRWNEVLEKIHFLRNSLNDADDFNNFTLD